MWQEPLSLFPWEGTGETKEAHLGLATFNNCSGLCSVGAVLCCPVPGLGDEGRRTLALSVTAQ